MTKKKPNQTNVNQVRQQNQQSSQGQSQYQNPMGEEFGSETDVNQVRQQNQQSEAKKQQYLQVCVLIDSQTVLSKWIDITCRQKLKTSAGFLFSSRINVKFQMLWFHLLTFY